MKRSMSGLLSPVVTPFGADLAPDPERWLEHCRWLIERDCGLAVFGTNSEANSLSTAEKSALLDRLAESGLPMARTMPGTGATDLPSAVELTRKAAALGCGGVLMLPPFYYKGVSDEGLFRFYAEVIERVGEPDLRVYLYHIPPVSGVPLSLALIERLLGAFPGTIAGIKDSGGAWENTRVMIERFDDFAVFCGSEDFLLETMRHGGAGCISATANVAPGPIVDLLRTWTEAGAEARQEALSALRRAVAAHPMIPALKATIAQATGDEAWLRVRPPLVALGEAARGDLRGALAAHDFSMPGRALREPA